MTIEIIQNKTILCELQYLIRAKHIDPVTKVEYTIRVVPSDVRITMLPGKVNAGVERAVFFVFSEQSVIARDALYKRMIALGGNPDAFPFISGVLPLGAITWL